MTIPTRAVMLDLQAENARLRAALEKITEEFGRDLECSAWRLSNIAEVALFQQNTAPK